MSDLSNSVIFEKGEENPFGKFLLVKAILICFQPRV